MWDRQAIIEKISDSADRFGANNPQQLKQLIFACEKSNDREIFFGLFAFFNDPELQENAMARQQLAGSILYSLCPACPIEIDGAVRALPKYWNLSIEEMPFYLCKVFGRKKVMAFLEGLIPDTEDEMIRKSFNALLFWTKGYEQVIT